MKICILAATTALLLGITLGAAQAQQRPVQSGSEIPPGAKGLADVTADPDGTLHFGPRTIPPNMTASPQSRAMFVETIKEHLAAQKQPPKSYAQLRARQAAFAQKALKLYPNVRRIESKIAGVPVIIWRPTDIAPRNAHRVALEFEIEAEGVQLAGIGKMEVISVLYGNGYANAAGIQDIVKVYRELLKTHKSSQIAMVGLSGGCQQAALTTLYLHYLKLPMPGALGLVTCAGGGGDSRMLMNGMDPELSLWDGGNQPAPGIAAGAAPPPPPPPVPGIHPGRIMDAAAVIPPGFPPSFLLAGTRDMALSGTVRLHQKLRQAGVIVDMDIFDGVWHGFQQHAELPESRSAYTDMWRFFDKYLAT